MVSVFQIMDRIQMDIRGPWGPGGGQDHLMLSAAPLAGLRWRKTGLPYGNRARTMSHGGAHAPRRW